MKNQTGRPGGSELVRLLSIAMPEDRRLPQHVENLGKDGGILSGLIAIEERTSEHEDEEKALAVKKIREHYNRHDCARRKMSDPPCGHPQHWEDVSQARMALWIIDLPCGTEVLPLADAALAWNKRKE